MYGSDEQYVARGREQAARGKACPVAVVCLACEGSTMCAPCAAEAQVWVQALAKLFPDRVDIEGVKSRRELVEDML